MKSLWILAFALATLLATGCSSTTTPSHFYGLKMDSVGSVDRLIINKYTIEDGVSYKYNSYLMDKKITAWGKLSSSGEYVSITIYNDSNTPIQTNYFTDSFALVTTVGKLYYLEKQPILSYPSGNYINPGQWMRFDPELPVALTKDQVSRIICELGAGQKTLIVLVPLPDPEGAIAVTE